MIKDGFVCLKQQPAWEPTYWSHPGSLRSLTANSEGQQVDPVSIPRRKLGLWEGGLCPREEPNPGARSAGPGRCPKRLRRSL